MTTGADSRIGPYLDLCAGREGGSGEPEVLRARRQQAIERFEAAGFPTSRDEEWRQTHLRPLLHARPRVSAARRGFPAGEELPFHYADCDRMVFVNGRYVPSASSPPEGVTAASLADPGAGADLVAGHLGATVDGRASCSADAGVHPFAALNTALYADGAVLGIPAGRLLERPVQVLWLSAPGADDAAPSDDSVPGSIEVSFPRLLVVAGEDSQAVVIETFAGVGPDDGGVYFVCPAAEFVCGAGSVVRHTRVQVDAGAALHLGSQHAQVERSAVFDSLSLSFGGALVRNDTAATLDGEGADCTLDGLYVASGAQFVDNHMRVEHRQPHTTSHQLYKGVLGDRSRSVFNGRIYVHRAAQKTDAKQTNRNLLLSEAALANSNPQLEIFADDVRCTHGSTIGRLDDEALFYMRARGIDLKEAHRMLVHAFAREVTDKVTFDPLRRDLEARLFARLDGSRGNGGAA